MIVLPTRKRLIHRRDALYDKLHDSLQCASVHEVENIMRKIHSINLKLRTYFLQKHEPKEVFEDNKDNGITTQNPFTLQDTV